MPRTNSYQFHINRQTVIEASQISHCLDLLSLAERRSLLAYYRPHAALTDAEAFAHRVAISKAEPSLPQRAGKALSRLINRLVDLIEATPGATSRDLRSLVRHHFAVRPGELHINVRIQFAPNPDIRKLANALIAYSAEQFAQHEERNAS